MRKAFKTVSSILFCLLFVVTAFLVVMKFMGEVPSLFGYNAYYILTGSMEPELSAGDIIIGKKTSPDELKVGDNITYIGDDGQTKGRIITHKIIEIITDDSGTEFITKGVANAVEDPPVSAENIISKMVMRVPFAGKVFSVVNNRIGFLVIIILPLAALVVSETVSLVITCKKIKEEQQIETEAERSDK